ncbi:E3 ubiquitin-protein ligase ATL4-like [Salvia miltiorrhiza]|uniref:E3 ubiquitin-protein ligase ATL4-like n=1 Tax=Salvia miltiorrhiza TaxID=226208 RepID=UPI0025AD3572|nr:E3 ubiquitin-protein ligase ATL4-like [Salvia miltiorrhiza]
MSAQPPPTTIFDGGSSSVITQMPQLPPPYTDRPSPSSRSSSSSDDVSSSSIVIVIIIIASAVIISASIYLLLRLLSKRIHRSFSAADDVVLRRDSSSQNPSQPQCHAAPPDALLDSLPVFTFRSVTGNLTGGDCAVCLSKFEPHDQLRLLPICCHAFHATCIDAWIVSNQTCPLCRSPVIVSDSEVFDKILPNPNRGAGAGGFRDGNGNSGSFRIEIGSISRRRGGGAPELAEGERRSYSIGSFEYIVDDSGYEVAAGSVTHRRGASDCTSADKESSVGIPIPEAPGEALAADVSSGRNWLRDYVDRLASVSFRSSGRFFSGSSRRSDPVAAAAAVDDLEANRVGEEISELFRWLSGI